MKKPLLTHPHLRSTLANGLRVVAIQRPDAPVALVAVDVRAGSRFESAADSGLSHFLEHMVFQGCDGAPKPMDVNLHAEGMGSMLNAFTGRESTRFEHHVGAEHIAESADLLARVLRTPRFESIETERQIVLEEALDEYDEDGRIVDADTLSRQAAWPGAAIGRSVIGSTAHIESFDVADLRRHHARLYTARNMVLSVVGPQAPEVLLRQVCKPFLKMPEGSVVPTPSISDKAPGLEVILLQEGRAQVDARLVFRTEGRDSPNAAALYLLQSVLDDGLASRMPKRLGAELGLAYENWCLWEAYHGTGVFELGSTVSPNKADTFFREALGLLIGIMRDPPRGEELERVRFRARWAALRAQDSADGLSAMYASPWLFEPARTPESRLAEVLSVTPEAMSACARRLLDPSRLVCCAVGPLDKGHRRAIKAAPRKVFRALAEA